MGNTTVLEPGSCGPAGNPKHKQDLSSYFVLPKMSSPSPTTLLSFISTFHVFLQLSEAAVALTKAKAHLGNPSLCIDPATGLSHKLGSEWSIKDTCGKAVCEERGSSLYISYSTCGQVHAEYPCKLVQDMDLPYPHCCKQSSCSNGTQFISTETPSIFEVASPQSVSSSSLDSKSSFYHKPVSVLPKLEDEKEIWDHTEVQDDMNVSYDVDKAATDDMIVNYDVDAAATYDMIVNYDVDTAATDDMFVHYDVDTAATDEYMDEDLFDWFSVTPFSDSTLH